MTSHSNRPTENQVYVALLRDVGVESLARDSVLACSTQPIVRGWCTALDRARRERITEATQGWIKEQLRRLGHEPVTDELRTLAAEVEAAFRLSWLGSVERVPEKKKTPTFDFKVEDMNIEVSCPQKHTHERQVAEADLANQLANAQGPVRVASAVMRPATGSGRSVASDGSIRQAPNSRAREYPANKIVDRVLHKKRDGRQFPEGGSNLLWLDLKHGLGMKTVDCIPFRSKLATRCCYTGTHGVWHAFYGEVGSPLFRERTTLELPPCRRTYQQQKIGWFRELRKVAAAVLSVTDGVLLFENPWASTPLIDTQRRTLLRLCELRPELSWVSCAGTLEGDVASMLARISRFADLANTERDRSPSPSESAP